MRIWHQSLTVLEDVPDYAERMRRYIRTIVRPETEVVLHGLLPGTYPANYPGDDISFNFFYSMHSLQFPLQALNAERQGFDAYAICTLPDPMLREARAVASIPVVGCGEVCFTEAGRDGRKFGMLVFIDRMAARYREQIAGMGLASQSVGVHPVGFRFRDVMAAFDAPGALLDRFRESARKLIAQGARCIVPGEIPLNVLLASEGVREVDGVPLIDSLGMTLQAAERAAGEKLAKADTWESAQPPRERVLDVLRFYGLDRFLKP